MDKCDDCPVRFLADPCYSKVAGVERFCTLVADEVAQADRPYTRVVYERSVGRQSPPPSTPEPERKKTPRPTLDLTSLRMFAISMCPAKGEKIGEGCNCLNKCSRGYGWFKAGEVSIQECMACVSGQTPRIQAQ